MCAQWAPNSQDLIVFLATHLSVFTRFHICYPRKGFHNHCTENNGLPYLKDRMNIRREQFAKAKQLGTKTVMKTWGLAWHKSFLASIISLHPSETVEYTTSARESSIVLFSTTPLENTFLMEDNPSAKQGSAWVGIGNLGRNFSKSFPATCGSIDGNASFVTAIEQTSPSYPRFPWERGRTPQPRSTEQASYLKSLKIDRISSNDSLDPRSSIASFNLVCARYLFEYVFENNSAILQTKFRQLFMNEEYTEVRSHKGYTEEWPSVNEKLDFINFAIGITGRISAAQRVLPIEMCICAQPLEWARSTDAVCPGGHRWRESF